MSAPRLSLLLLLVACATTGPPPGEARPGEQAAVGRSLLGRPLPRTGVLTRFDLGSLDALEQAGWTRASGRGAPMFADGRLRLGPEPVAWEQRPEGPPSRWWARVDSARGWAVEARLKVVETQGEGPIRLWVHDGSRAAVLLLDAHGIALQGAGESYPMRTTDGFHVYRVEGQGDWVRVAVDGVARLELRGGAVARDLATRTLLFGAFGTSRSEWEWVGYDTAPEGLVPVPCAYCRPDESPRVGQLRERLRDHVRRVDRVASPGTADADERCLLVATLDALVRRFGPRWAEAEGHEVEAAGLRRLPSLSEPEGRAAFEALYGAWRERVAREAEPSIEEGPPGRFHRVEPHPTAPARWAGTVHAMIRDAHERRTERAWWLLGRLLREDLPEDADPRAVFRAFATELAPRCVAPRGRAIPDR